MKGLPNDKHIEFLKHQIRVLEEDWLSYSKSSLKILISERRLFVGKLWALGNDGTIVLRFKSGSAPRIKHHYFLGFAGTDFPNSVEDFNFSYRDFRLSEEPRYYSGKHGEVFTVGIQQSVDSFTYVKISGLKAELAQELNSAYLVKGKNPPVIIAETDPPVQYLFELVEFVRNNPNDVLLNIDATLGENDWTPTLLDNEKDVVPQLVDAIDRNELTIVQGPPGTGKSYLAAQLCEYYMSKGQSVAVTALTNSALIEIVQKDGLKKARLQGRVSKTNLSSDEEKKVPGLRDMHSLSPANGETGLLTYYMLALKRAELEESTKRFDLLIIEEASQALLATLAMFRLLAKRVLIIGDHKQLVPIVLNEEKALRIHPKVRLAIAGLETVAFSHSRDSYRLTKTRRLGHSAASLTGLFYNNALKSIAPTANDLRFPFEFSHLQNKSFGNHLVKLLASEPNNHPAKIVLRICALASGLLKQNPKMTLAILVPTVFLETQLYEWFSKMSSDFERLTISTVHKIQGLTVDFTVVFLPLQHPSFELNENLFNVSTSRAKLGTLIITYQHIDLIQNISHEVIQFLGACKQTDKL